MLHRNSYMEVNLKNIENNIKKIIKKYDYKYYFGVVKSNNYSLGSTSIDSIIKGGCNYLAVATLDEALEIRNNYKDIPILCLGIIPIEFISICVKNNITITISNIDYLKELIEYKHDNLKVHIKINSGMNRLGFKDINEINEAYNIIKNSNIILEGVYSHIYNASNEIDTLKQYELFEYLTKDIDLSSIPIVHINASESTVNYKRKDYMNGCRLGIIMYGITNNKELNLSSTFKLCSEVIQINNVSSGESVGYSGIYKCKKNEKIAIIPVGYADGITRNNTGRYVYINNRKYNIVGNICMDMLFVKVDDKVNVHDTVYLIKDNEHLKYISEYLNTIPYEIMCLISKRIERLYIK